MREAVEVAGLFDEMTTLIGLGVLNVDLITWHNDAKSNMTNLKLNVTKVSVHFIMHGKKYLMSFKIST
nr:7213_t:CDS:2 [Entrophospora candida]